MTLKIVFRLILIIGISAALGYAGFKWLNSTSYVRKYTSKMFETKPEPCVIEDVNYAYYDGSDPLWKENNKFGLYIYAESGDYFEFAQNLVNSNGGEWGYVLIPYNVKDRDLAKWTKVFEKLANKKLIPIIQLHDVDPEKYKEQTRKAADFLDNFLWPIRYRYISVYNEPNDSKFWYGRVDPAEYATILNYTIDTFKQVNSDYFMLNAGFNSSAASNGAHLDSLVYMKLMNDEVPGIFEKLDGWASHSYPQPNFSASPYNYGRWSIRAYESELSYLKNSLGVSKDLPVFITETGWAHAEGKDFESSYLSQDQVAENFKIAYQEVWLKDDRVRAVTPFTIKYDPPFDHFSWLTKDKVPYPQYDAIKKLSKIKGDPPILKTKTVKISKCPADSAPATEIK